MTHPVPRKSQPVIRHIPQSRLTTLVNRPGGMWREKAIAEAERRVEELRGPSMDALDEEIELLEAIATDFVDRPRERLMDVRRAADHIITLAGTFGLLSLNEAAKRLCDLAIAFANRDTMDRDSIAVHLRAVRLFGPKSAVVSADAALVILAELRKVLEHFDVAIPDESPESPFDSGSRVVPSTKSS